MAKPLKSAFPRPRIPEYLRIGWSVPPLHGIPARGRCGCLPRRAAPGKCKSPDRHARRGPGSS